MTAGIKRRIDRKVMQKEKGVGRFKTIFLFLGAAAVFIGIICYDLGSIRKSLWEQTVLGVREVISQGSHAFSIYVEKDMQILSRIVEHVSEERPEHLETIKAMIDSFVYSGVGFAVNDQEQVL